MIISTEYSGNTDKVKKYIDQLGIDHTSYIIVIKDGTWTFDIFGKANGRRIEAYAPKWLSWCRDFVNSRIIYHEYLHTLGIKECESPWYKKIFCIMYENDKHYLREMMVIPFQLLHGLKPCNNCEKKIKK